MIRHKWKEGRGEVCMGGVRWAREGGRASSVVVRRSRLQVYPFYCDVFVLCRQIEILVPEVNKVSGIHGRL